MPFLFGKLKVKKKKNDFSANLLICMVPVLIPVKTSNRLQLSLITGKIGVFFLFCASTGSFPSFTEIVLNIGTISARLFGEAMCH